jgi:hypothetical protein
MGTGLRFFFFGLSGVVMQHKIDYMGAYFVNKIKDSFSVLS